MGLENVSFFMFLLDVSNLKRQGQREALKEMLHFHFPLLGPFLFLVSSIFGFLHYGTN